MENETLVNAGAEVTVEPQKPTGAAQTAEAATGTPEDRQSQSKEENAAFAAMRRQYEQDLSARDDRLSLLDSAAKAAGYQTVEDMIDTQKANELGVSLTEYRAAEKEKAEQRKNDVFESEEYKKLKAKYDALQGQTEAELSARQMASDLAEVQKVFPDVKTLEELGDVYSTLIASGKDAVTAAKAAMAAKAKAPKDIGAVGQQQATAGEYYSQAQIDYYNDHPELLNKMSDAEFAKLCRSMSKH